MCENSLYPKGQSALIQKRVEGLTDALKDTFLVINGLFGAMDLHCLFPQLLDLINQAEL